jgi:hypothetical protein
MSETLNHITSVSHMGATYFYNTKTAHKSLETSGNLVGHQTVETPIHTQILRGVCRFDIICVLCYFPVAMMMECFPFTDLNNSPILIKIPVMC